MSEYPTAAEIAKELARELLGTTDDKPAQLTRHDLASMTPDQIVEAHRLGALDDAIASRGKSAPPDQNADRPNLIDRLKTMSPDEVLKLHRDKGTAALTEQYKRDMHARKDKGKR